AERGRREAQPSLLAVRRARAGMDHDAEQPERLGAIEFVDERVDRLPPQRVEGGCMVDQIARVRDRGADGRLLEAGAEALHVAGIERLPLPSVAVLGEDLQRLA